MKATVVLLLVVGCQHPETNRQSDGGTVGSNSPVDAAIPRDGSSTMMMTDASPPNTVTLHVEGDVAQLVAYRDGQGPWHAAAGSGSQYALHVTSDYEVAVVCQDFATELAFVVTDGADQVYHCPLDKTPTVNVTGALQQAGTVELASANAIFDRATEIDLSSTVGTHDLFAYDSTHLLMRHDIAIGSGGTDLGTIDIDGAGGALGTSTITVTNQLTNDQPIVFHGVATHNGDVFSLNSSLGPIAIPPASVLASQDHQWLEAEASNTHSSRTVRDDAFDPTTTTSIALPDPFTTPTFSVTTTAYTATWTTLPDADSIVLDISEDLSDVEIKASRGYLAVHPGSLAFDPTVPGFQSSWLIDVTRPSSSSLTATTLTGTITTTVQVF